MLCVVDSNVVFSSLIRRGKPFAVFEANRIFRTFEFVAPEFMFAEIGKQKGRVLLETELSKEELSFILSLIKGDIKVISFSEFLDKLPEAQELNFKDSPYLALALKLSCPIFSGDKRLREQTKVKILSPSEALDMIYGVG